MAIFGKTEDPLDEDKFKRKGLEALARHYAINERDIGVIGKILSLSEFTGIQKIDVHRDASGKKVLGKYDVLVADSLELPDLKKKFLFAKLPQLEIIFDHKKEPVYSFTQNGGLDVEVHIKRQESWRTRPAYEEK
jgi:hypothetical protein